MGNITVTRRFRIAKFLPFRYPRWPPWQPSWSSSNDISSQTIGLIESKLDWRHRSDIEIQNCLNCQPSWKSSNNISSGYLVSFQLLSAPEQYIGWRGNLMEGIGAAWRFRIVKMIPFWYPRWPPWQLSWKSWNHICYRRLSLIELKHDGRYWGDMEIQNC